AWKDGFVPILQAGFRNATNESLAKVGMHLSTLGQEIVEAAPLILCGLSVAFAFKTGLFNIGAAGQYTGAPSADSMPPWCCTFPGGCASSSQQSSAPSGAPSPASSRPTSTSTRSSPPSCSTGW